MTARAADQARLCDALSQAALVLRRYAGSPISFSNKRGHGPVTAADHEVDDLLRRILPLDGEGWLSEETVDDERRLACRRVWIVDPIDGTRSFVVGRPEYSISIALVEDGVPVLGGVCNPATGVTVVGGPGLGIEVQGDAKLPFREGGDVMRVLASRSECRCGEWDHWLAHGNVEVLPISSVAYKLALVAAGAADATWTVWQKSEWDIAAGLALVRAVSGFAFAPGIDDVVLNRPQPVFRGFAAAGPLHRERMLRLLRDPNGGRWPS
ncbi:MAG: inositol monophosphatase family protein [Planctomycetota bacterium]